MIEYSAVFRRILTWKMVVSSSVDNHDRIFRRIYRLQRQEVCDLLYTCTYLLYTFIGDASFFFTRPWAMPYSFTRLNTCFWIQLYYTHLLQTSTRRYSMSIISTHINLFYTYRYLLNKVIHWRIIHCKRLCFKCDLRHNTFCTNIQNCWRVLYHMHNLLYSEILK